MSWKDGLIELAARRLGPGQCAVVLTSTMRQDRVQGVYATLEEARARALETATTEVRAKRTCVPYLVASHEGDLVLYQAGRWNGEAWVEDEVAATPISIKGQLDCSSPPPGRPLRPSALAERGHLFAG